MESKEILSALHADFETFKKEHSAAVKAKADGKAVADLDEKVAKIQSEISAKMERIAQIETAVNRTAATADAEPDVTEATLRKAFRAWMSKGDRDQPLSDALMVELNKNPKAKAAYIEKHHELKALSVNDDTGGGFLVHADLSGRIVKRIYETSPIRQYAAVATISTDALEGVLDYDQIGSGWVAETGSRAETTTPKIGVWRIQTHEMYAKPRVSQKVLDDAAYDLESWIGMKTADRFARLENTAFCTGTGAGQPRGFLTETLISDASNASASYDSYIADRKIGYIPTGVSGAFPAVPTTGAPTAQGNPILDTVYALKTQYRDAPGTAWAMHRTTVGSVMKLQDALGRYLWQPSLTVGAPSTLCGIPIAEFNDMPVIAAGSLSIALANWREAYQIVDRIGIRLIRDPYSAKPMVEFYSTKRVGGAVLNHEAIKLVKFGAS